MAGYGIDFGTTNSVLVRYDKSTNSFKYYQHEGATPVPVSSTIMYCDKDIVVGDEAREKLLDYAGEPGYHFEKSIKLKLGKDIDLDIFGSKVKPYKVAGDIIKYLKQNAINIGENKESLSNAIFTVPINYDGKARKDLRLAAAEGGLQIKSFIHEPFAAIVGYYFTKDDRKSVNDINQEINSLNGKKVLTFDWGGGTLDITVVKIENGKLMEIGTSELTDCAGDKFDEDIANYVWNDFCDNHVDFSEEELAFYKEKIWGKLVIRSERCKKALSDDDEYTIAQIVDVPNHLFINKKITKERFEKIINSNIEKAIHKIDIALKQANLKDLDIDLVLLTGGSCNIPIVQERIKEKFGSRVEILKNANLVIAQGAAVISEMGWKPFLTKNILIEMCDDTYYTLYDRDYSPVDSVIKRNERFICVDEREHIAKIVLYEGIKNEPDKRLAVIQVPLKSNKNFGDEIELQSEIDENVILNIKAVSLFSNEGYLYQIHKLCFGLNINNIW